MYINSQNSSQWYKYHLIINIVKEERIQKYDIISSLYSERMDKWGSAMFHVSGLLTTENDVFYLLLLKTNTITHLKPIFHWEKKHQVKLISRFSHISILLLLLESWERTNQISIKNLNRNGSPYCTLTCEGFVPSQIEWIRN